MLKKQTSMSKIHVTFVIKKIVNLKPHCRKTITFY